MKKGLFRVFCLLLSGCLLLSMTALFASADGYTEPAAWALNGVNTECRTGFLVAYTGTGKTGTNDKCTDVSVDANGKVISIGANNAEIPKGGFVLSGSGAKVTSLKKLAVGDGLWLDEEASLVIMVPKAYDPFRQNVVTYTRVNSTRVTDSIVLYNQGERTNTNDYGYEVVVDKNGYVTEIGTNNTLIPAGGYVISGHGAGKNTLISAAAVGNKAILNTSAKTVTFQTDASSNVREMSTYADGFKTAWETAFKAGKLLDYEAVKAMQTRLNALAKQGEDSLKEDGRLHYVVAMYQYEKLKAQSEMLLVEPSVVEGRAVWIRPDLTTSKDQVYRTVKAIYEAGFNQVYVELLFDNTTIMPVPKDSYYTQNPKLSGADLLSFYVEACHAYRIEIHGWYSVCRVGYKGSVNTQYSVAMKKPEWKNVSKNGVDYVANAYGDAFFVNPALPEVREFLLGTCEYIAENYDLDGLHLDYIRYPNANDGEDFGYDEVTRNAFKQKYGTDPRSLSVGSAQYAAFCQFRADYVTMLVRSIAEMLAAKRPDMVLSAAVAPNYNSSMSAMCQDAPTWMKEGFVDYILPMAYGSTDLVRRCITNTSASAGDRVLGFYGMSDQGADILKEQIVATRESGADGFGFFSWNVYGTKYADVGKTVLAEKALSPLWSAKASLAALLGVTADRLALLGKSDLQKKYETAAEALKDSSVEEQKSALLSLFADSAKASGLTADQKALLGNDLARMTRIVKLNRDAAKADYRKTHPLPESKVPENLPDQPDQPSDEPVGETSSTVSDEPAESSEMSVPAEGSAVPGTSEEPVSEAESAEGPAENSVEASAEESKGEPLNAFEKTAQIISIIVIFGGLLLFPVYFILNSRKKRIARQYREEHPEDEKPQE